MVVLVLLAAANLAVSLFEERDTLQLCFQGKLRVGVRGSACNVHSSWGCRQCCVLFPTAPAAVPVTLLAFVTGPQGGTLL